MNLEASDDKTRFAAYNLLSYMTDKFQLPLSKVIESEVISIPHNTTAFVVQASKTVSVARADLTLEFLLEGTFIFYL
jgi:hypothetical protein